MPWQLSIELYTRFLNFIFRFNVKAIINNLWVDVGISAFLYLRFFTDELILTYRIFIYDRRAVVSINYTHEAS